MESLSVDINVSEVIILDFLKEPFNLRFWTVHRDLYYIDNKCHECIFREGKANFAEIRTTFESTYQGIHSARFSWHQNDALTKSFNFQITATSDSQVKLSMEIPKIQHQEKQNTLF